MKKIFVTLTYIIFSLHFTVLAQIRSEPPNFNNPILSGFHPDPSVIRVGEDYYLVNSSFEWFPGIPIYHSLDLVNWELIGYGITRPDQVPLPKGLKDSRGIYAVTIRYHEGLFYLITTCVQCDGNFYITAKNPAGPWSNPIWTGTRGIDPSLFWDDDGRSYYVGHANISGLNDWPDKNGAWMQEINLKTGEMKGEPKQLTHGHAANARWTEGPHLYKINGKYTLMVAEGGTGFHHAVTVHHSDSLWGPYVPDHANPVLTHRNLGQNYPIHSVGHADLVQTQKGDWWAVALGKRLKDSITLLARETFLVPVNFEGQTPVFNPGEGRLLQSQKRPDLSWHPFNSDSDRILFDKGKLPLQFNFLRTPNTKWYEIKEGKLKIQLRPEVIDSLVNPSFIARRIEDYKFKAATSFDFMAKKESEAAGLVIYRNSTNHIKFLKTKANIVVKITDNGSVIEELQIPFKAKKCILQVQVNGRELKLFYGSKETDLIEVGNIFDLEVISDENAGGFNGPYIGMYATSRGNESRNVASFDWFEYIKN
ncbi:glycoside hydrolase family 43 protein [Leeuwenhoekiella parthenopeia]|uniref:Glycoside hydrolase family 43 protein n=1 Tax=Leeuwenhoekiella parthenopeia TaxID=2890320 RepID=A0ABS8GMR5_9FLAO|nr:glycoside hydrolase family 43 protein [Leeuwenhoekiella parthenopeia]MCC4211274.1 glycoside hydrolase family 43 protein [Leeuwenhoekiella parthenopeia]